MNESETVTVRELHTQLSVLRTEINNRFDKIETTVATMFDRHQDEHKRDVDRRNSFWRWAVTSVITGMGVIAALGTAYLATRH